MEKDIIFLSKNGTDEYVNALASSFGATPTSDKDFVYENTSGAIVLRGILKHKLMKDCLRDKRDFYYIDSGYFGNYKSSINPNGWKLYHRIVKNNLQHTDFIEKPNDRLQKLNVEINDWKKDGKNILLVMPSPKPAKYYDIDLEKWKENTYNTIRQHTDRPIIVREKANRKDRVLQPIHEEFKNAFAVVTLQSIAATEAIIYGIPAFTLAPNAAEKFCLQDLTKIETPMYADREKIYKWACYLAYGQFHVDELRNGTAKRLLNL